MNVELIPSIMHDKGWCNGERLMQIWFERPPNAVPKAGAPETATIRLDSWALTFSRCREAYEGIIRNRAWRCPEARKNLGHWLANNRKLSQQRICFGDLNRPVSALDRDFIYQVPVGSLTDPLDDMFAALGKFNLRIVLAGSISGLTIPSPVNRTSRYQVQIDRVGVYIYDSYDFNGFQLLGFWSELCRDVARGPTGDYEAVYNSTFREWREKNKKGGDFLVFSDLKVIPLNPPDTFELPPNI